jgi:hypothetical protein
MPTPWRATSERRLRLRSSLGCIAFRTLLVETERSQAGGIRFDGGFVRLVLGHRFRAVGGAIEGLLGLCGPIQGSSVFLRHHHLQGFWRPIMRASGARANSAICPL